MWKMMGRLPHPTDARWERWPYAVLRLRLVLASVIVGRPVLVTAGLPSMAPPPRLAPPPPPSPPPAIIPAAVRVGRAVQASRALVQAANALAVAGDDVPDALHLSISYADGLDVMLHLCFVESDGDEVLDDD